jgi:hypothetical protein
MDAYAVGLYERIGFVPSGVTATWPPPRAHITECFERCAVWVEGSTGSCSPAA